MSVQFKRDQTRNNARAEGTQNPRAHRSAMSMGAWILSAFGACVVPGLIALELHAHQIFPGTLDQILRVVAALFIFGSAIFGTLLATYTGVLIGVTAIPAW